MHTKTKSSLFNLDHQEYIAYGKEPIVLQALKKHLGDEQYHNVLRNFINLHQHDIQATLPELVTLFAEKSRSPEYVHRLFNEAGLAAQALTTRISED